MSASEGVSKGDWTGRC